MEESRSKFENFSDKQLLKYAVYAKKVLGDKWTVPFIDFYNNIFESDREYTLLDNPINWKLSRYDVEYLYYILHYNDLEEGISDRPSLFTTYPEYITEERVYVKVTRSRGVQTYVPNDIDSGYMYALEDSGDINPWDWDIIDKDERDSDINDSYYEI
jgi:hypothetical protein